MSVLTRPAATKTSRPVAISGAGSYLHTNEGRTVLDGCSGAVNVNLGHGHPRVLAAMRDQMDQLSFAYRTHFDTEAGLRLRDRIARLTGSTYPTVQLTNSGSEAVEQALRVAWRHHQAHGQTGRDLVLAEAPSYHGMTLGALAVSGHPLRRGSVFPGWLGGLSESVRHVPAPPMPGARADAATWVQAIETAGKRLAAVVLEPVGGASSGAAVCPPDTQRAIRAAATAAGALVISDEVMTGFGRLGCWSPSARDGLDADVVVASKGLGAGYHPIGAVLLGAAAAETAATLPDGGVFGHTMAGSPLGSATADAVLAELTEQQLLPRALQSGELLRRLLAETAAPTRCLGPVRGSGLLLAVPVRHPDLATGDGGCSCSAGSSPAPATHDSDALGWAKAFADHALAEDLLVYPAGVGCPSACVLVAPPLTSSLSDLHEVARRTASAARHFEETLS